MVVVVVVVVVVVPALVMVVVQNLHLYAIRRKSNKKYFRLGNSVEHAADTENLRGYFPFSPLSKVHPFHFAVAAHPPALTTKYCENAASSSNVMDSFFRQIEILLSLILDEKQVGLVERIYFKFEKMWKDRLHQYFVKSIYIYI